MSKHYQRKRKHSDHQQSWGGSGGKHSEPLSGVFRGGAPVRKLLGSTEHLDWLKIDLNVVKKITVQDHKHTKK